MNEPITLKDIAEKLGLSIGTVQRALHNKGGYSAETQKRVLEEARKCNYVVNSAASALRMNKLKIAVVLPNPKDANRYFFSYVWEGIEKAVKNERLYDVELDRLYAEPGSADALNILHGIIRNCKVQGLIYYNKGTSDEREVLEMFRANSIPVYLINETSYAKDPMGVLVGKNEGIGALGADLISSMSRSSEGQVLILGGPRDSSKHRERVGEFCDALSSECPMMIIQEMHIYDDLALLARQLRNFLSRQNDVTAMFSVSSRETMTMCRVVKAMNLSGTITTVGMDVFGDLIPYFEDGTLSASIYQYPAQKAYVGCRKLIESAVTGNFTRADITFPVSAVFRGNAEAFCNADAFFWD